MRVAPNSLSYATMNSLIFELCTTKLKDKTIQGLTRCRNTFLTFPVINKLHQLAAEKTARRILNVVSCICKSYIQSYFFI